MTCNSAHEQIPLSNDTIDSVLRHRDVDRAKDLSATPRNYSVYFSSCSVGRITVFKICLVYIYALGVEVKNSLICRSTCSVHVFVIRISK